MRPLKRFLVLFVVRMTLYKIKESIANEQKNYNYSVRNIKLLDTLDPFDFEILGKEMEALEYWNHRKYESLIKTVVEVMPIANQSKLDAKSSK